MKKTIIMIACVAMILSSCGTSAGEGAFAGAAMGGMMGSAIGGITGGWRGRDMGTLIGAASGAALGAAAGAAADDSEARAVRRHRSGTSSRNTYEQYESDRDQGYYVGTDKYSRVRERIRQGKTRPRSNYPTGNSQQGYHYAPANRATSSTSSSNPGFHFEAIPDSSGFKKEGGYDDRIDMD